MMDDVRYNFYEVVDSAEVYFEKNGKGKGSGWKGYQRWKNENESKFYPSGERLNAYYDGAQLSFQTLQSENPNKHQKATLGIWKELGPWDANNITSHYSPGIGRVETFWVNPNNTKTIFLGSRSGGFWRTFDEGKNWENTTDTLVVSGVVSLAVNPFDVNDIIIAVQQGGNANTHGIYRSKNAGKTWVQTKFNPTQTNIGGLGRNQRIYKLAFHPTRKGTIYVGTSNGLYLSKNDLDSWTLVFSGYATDIEFHPTERNIVYAYNNYQSGRNYLRISTDTGSNWNNSAVISNNNNAKLHIAVSKNQPDNVYVASTNGVWRSKNKGAFFTFISNPEESCLGFSVSDLDVNKMIYGYVDVEASDDEGKTFSQVTFWNNRNAAYVHADVRTLECINGVFYVGTDGYLAKSDDNGKTWTRLNDGTAIREFYALGLSQSNQEINIAGSQDNGTSILNETGWVEWNGGDGMEAIAQPLNNEWYIGSWQYGSRNYTQDGGQTRTSAENPRRGSGQADWEAPLLLDPLNHMKLYHFADTIYSSLDFGETWQFYSAPQIGIIKEAAIAQGNSQIIAIARNSTIRLTTDGGNTWKNILSNLPSYSITDIEFDPKSDSTIVVTYNRYQNDNRKIFISNDLGATWVNITSNLGNMPIRTVTIDPSDSSYIYVGGEIGVYYKSKKGNDWKLMDNGLPNVTVKDLEINYGSNTLRAATWGRGLWQTDLAASSNKPKIVRTGIMDSPTDLLPKKGIDQIVTADIRSENPISTVSVYWSKNSTSLDNSITMTNTSGDNWQSATGIPSEEEGDQIYFVISVINENGLETKSYRYNYTVRPFVYCFGRGGSGTGADWIKYVGLENLAHYSNQEYYGDYTDSIVELYQKHDYLLEMGLNYHFDLNKIGAWIDYNHNAEFDDDERITMGEIDNSHVGYGQFKVPSDVILDKPLRMRVVCRYTTRELNPCGTESGEVEDYTIIVRKDTLSNTFNFATKQSIVFPNPNNGSFTIQLDGIEKFKSLVVYDNSGRIVYSEKIKNDHKSELDVVCDLRPGVYIATINSEGQTFQQKLIIK